MTKRYLSALIVVCCLMISVCGTVFGATHNVQVDPGGFYPSLLNINVGDTVRFYNYTGYSLLTIYHMSGPCWNWIIDSPAGGYGSLTFNCGPGTEVYSDSTFGFFGSIVISEPPPTPTPDLITPSMSPSGLMTTLGLVSLIILLPGFRKKRQSDTE